jgi:hypothetical protein
MSSHIRHTRALVAVVTVASFLLSLVAPMLNAQTAAPTPAPATASPTGPTSGDEVDGGWPRDYTTPAGAALRVFQPQIATWDGQKKMVAYSAASYNTKGAQKPNLGTLKFEADTSVAVAERLVNFSNVKLTETHFENIPKEQLQDIATQVDNTVKEDGMVIALDRVLANLDKSQIIPKNVEGVKADPPAIYYSTTAAALVNIDGEPIWSPIQGNDLKFAVNTNWDLFQLADAFYLRYEQSWFTAKSITGPWTAATKLPEAFSKLPADENWKEVKAAIPGRALSASTTPKLFVSLQPAELILLQGAPNYLSVSGTKLLWVSNTESDIFRLGKAGLVYYLVAGRWFSAPDFTGPWTFATTNLPDDFKKIPLSHERSRVLASVPGTDQAMEAVLLAQVPETARVSKKLAAPEVQYQGDPKFEPVEKTKVSRAVNTDKDIIKVGDLYYMCFQGVWFMGRSPTGPWEVTSSVPGEIYEIPVSSPSHAVTYVTVEDDDDDAVVFATAAMYTGVMVAWGCAVWGTGWYYPPYYYGGGFYPYYRPYYPTYGFGASYNPWTGAYTRGAVAYGPYGGAGVASRYNPRTGTYSRGAAAWGPYGARGAASAYNPRTGAVGATRQGSSVYGSWGQTGVARGDQWASTSRVTNNRGTTTRVTQGSGGNTAITRNPVGAGNASGVVRSDSGDVYAGRDGNVYKRQSDGSWQQYDKGTGNWNSTQATQQQRDQAQQRAQDARGQAGTTSRPATADSGTTGQLNRDSAARSSGTQRTQDYGNYNRGGGASSRGASTYRPSGGGARAGGGRRR